MHYCINMRSLKREKKYQDLEGSTPGKQQFYLHGLKENHQLRAAQSLTHLSSGQYMCEYINE